MRESRFTEQLEPQPKRRFRALVELYTPEGIIHAGEVTEQIPKQSINWLLSDGLIQEEVTDGV